MKQIWVAKSGPPQQLEIREGPDPTPGNGEVRIKVEASGANFADVLSRAGIDSSVAQPPFAPGFEVAGTIDMVAQGVSNFKEGDRVLALTHLGGYSDLICVPYRQVFRRLEWMSAEDGASLPVDYLSAFVSLYVMGSVRKRDKVLIHAADSSFGLAALHVCRILGAETYGTAPEERHALLEEHGLGHAVDHMNNDYEEAVREKSGGTGVSVVLNPYGGIHQTKNYRLLQPGGRLIQYGQHTPMVGGQSRLPAQLLRILSGPVYTPQSLMNDNKGVLGVRFDRLWLQPEYLRQPMQQIIDWYDEALFRPVIDRTFRLSRAAEAHDYLQKGENLGKVLLIP